MLVDLKERIVFCKFKGFYSAEELYILIDRLVRLQEAMFDVPNSIVAIREDLHIYKNPVDGYQERVRINLKREKENPLDDFPLDF